MNVHIILFYKFTEIKDPDRFAKVHLEYCKSKGFLGKVLVAKEGINGSLSGTKEEMEDYMSYLTSQEQFSDVRFKIETATFSPFKKMIVRIKNEIIRMDKEVDIEKTGKYISPEELLELYQSGEDFVILDTRNNYESHVGKFKNAITPDIETFRDFPDALKEYEGHKDKKIITYCTGGIRCEKATAYMVEQGFKDVYQLKDGIINFCQQYPDTIWEGKCFVFDQRMVSNVDPEGGTISTCVWCGGATDRYANCRVPSCDDLVVICESCGSFKNGCCSQECFDEFERVSKIKSHARQGYKFKQNALKEEE